MSMAGHALRGNESRWITKTREPSNLIYSEFHHISSRLYYSEEGSLDCLLLYERHKDHMDKGKLPEWSNGPHSKCGDRVTGPGVRIPHFPLSCEGSTTRKQSQSLTFRKVVRDRRRESKVNSSLFIHLFHIKTGIHLVYFIHNTIILFLS